MATESTQSSMCLEPSGVPLELQCPACNHLFDNPVFLPCSHTFCKFCAAHLIETAEPILQVRFCFSQARTTFFSSRCLIVSNAACKHEMITTYSTLWSSIYWKPRRWDKTSPLLWLCLLTFWTTFSYFRNTKNIWLPKTFKYFSFRDIYTFSGKNKMTYDRLYSSLHHRVHSKTFRSDKTRL